MSTELMRMDVRFTIRAERRAAALRALKAEWERRNFQHRGIERALLLEDALAACMFRVTTDDDGNLVDLEYRADKCGQQFELLFRTLAPYVKRGSRLKLYLGFSDGRIRAGYFWFDGTEMFGSLDYIY